MQERHPEVETRLRSLPSVDALAGLLPDSSPPKARVASARVALECARQEILGGGEAPSTAKLVASAVAAEPRRSSAPSALNLSGVVLHTGLGRATLATAAVEAMTRAGGHLLLEYDAQTGERGDRQTMVRDHLCALTGAEDALVVNNAAGAVLLALAATSAGGEVILSRGQMVEIGGQFRMPDVVRASGCRLVEVGCTNRTHLRDYADAITPETRAILRCHPSNFRVVGFASEPSLRELAELAVQRDVLCLDDMGTGCLVDTAQFGLPRQATLPQTIQDGADLVMASGDKLMGGPQAGILVGRSRLIDLAKRHPLARALRTDKLSLLALEATLAIYRFGNPLLEIPTLAYLARTQAEVKSLAQRVRRGFGSKVRLEPGLTEVGGGSLPGVGLPTWRLGLPGDPEAVAARLRMGTPAVVARVERGICWLDPRALDARDVAALRERLEAIL